MPKFYGQNKKRIDPRYFLAETSLRSEGRDLMVGEYTVDDIEKALEPTQGPPGTNNQPVPNYFTRTGMQSSEEVGAALKKFLPKLPWSTIESDNLEIIHQLEVAGFIDSVGEYHDKKLMAATIANSIEGTEQGSPIDPRAKDYQQTSYEADPEKLSDYDKMMAAYKK